MKTNVTDLAILGGRPAFAELLHVGRPNLGDQERFLARIGGMFERRWLSNGGPLLTEFERQIAQMVGVRHCMAVSNATVGLELLIRALGLQGEVIVPSFTFIATAHALHSQGVKPVFCDIDRDTHQLDPKCIESLITPRTSGILGVHLWGQPSAVEELQTIADRHGLTLFFDAAHSIASTHRGRAIGSFGAAEVFSFHATKFFNTAEGGAIVTNDDSLAAKIAQSRQFGFSGVDSVVTWGTNAKMTELSAALGLTNLESIDQFIEVNEANFQCYKENLSGISGVTLHEVACESERRNFQYVVVEIDAAVTGLGRDELVRILHAENVLVRRYFFPGCHRMEPYRSLMPEVSLPVTDLVASRVMVLPTGTAVSHDQIRTICELIRFAIAHREAIAGALS